MLNNAFLNFRVTRDFPNLSHKKFDGIEHCNYDHWRARLYFQCVLNLLPRLEMVAFVLLYKLGLLGACFIMRIIIHWVIIPKIQLRVHFLLHFWRKGFY